MQVIRLAALIVATGLASCATKGGGDDDALPAPPAQAVFDSLIVPGQRIGPVSLGMTGAQLLSTVGSPVSSDHFVAQTSARFSNGINVTMRDSDNRVMAVTTTDSRYGTAEGLRVGISEFEVRSRLGPPAGALDESGSDRYLCYPGRWFGIERSSSRVKTIAVTAGTPCTWARR